MSEDIRVRLHWLTSESAGRRDPDASSRFVSVARFADEGERGKMIGWGVSVKVEQPLGDTPDALARVKFIVPPGPVHYLHPGSRFELYEGNQVVARGEVLAEAEGVPASTAPVPVSIKELPVNPYMTTDQTQPAIEALQAELAEKEEALRKLVRQIDQISRTEFRDRAQRLRMMRDQRTALESAIDALKTRLKAAGA